MYLDVIIYQQACGKDKIILPFYKIMHEENELFKQDVYELMDLGIKSAVNLSVTCDDGNIDYKTGYIKMKKDGIRRHISLIVNNDKFGKVLNRQIIERVESLLENVE